MVVLQKEGKGKKARAHTPRVGRHIAGDESCMDESASQVEWFTPK